MTQTGYSNAIVDAMLGWLKGLATWVLRLFNLSGGASPLKFLAGNWLQLLVILLIMGVAIDLVVWLIRWRPHWVWFRKKRVIINDRNFFKTEDPGAPAVARGEGSRPERIARPKRDWEESEYVVPSAARRRREARIAEENAARARAAEEAKGDVFTDGMFNVNAKQKYSDKYEDEVFSVSNLPRIDKGEAESRPALPVVTDRSRRRAAPASAAKPGGAEPRTKAKARPAAKAKARPAAKPRASMARGEKRAPSKGRGGARRR